MKERHGAIKVLVAACALVWVWAAIAPVDREAWALENVLLVASAGALFFARKKLRFSDAAYAFIGLFFLLHIVGAHYTYTRMPLGLWFQDAWHLARNPYDRVTHFAFGFLLVFPVRELLVRFAEIGRGWGLWLAAAVILALSGLFESLEGVTAEYIAPGAGVAWLGGQGDEWDAQNDMLMALSGALLMMALLALRSRFPKNRA